MHDEWEQFADAVTKVINNYKLLMEDQDNSDTIDNEQQQQ